LDGRLVVCYHGKVLTPSEAPPLAQELRASATSKPALWYVEPEVPETKKEPLKAQPGKIWWEDSDLRHLHRELVKTGVKRARENGKRIGRPRVNERPEFSKWFAGVIDRMALGMLSRRKAARELDIGYATLVRLLNARSPHLDQVAIGVSSIADMERHCSAFAQVVH
jgi:hypothetical protein